MEKSTSKKIQHKIFSQKDIEKIITFFKSLFEKNSEASKLTVSLICPNEETLTFKGSEVGSELKSALDINKVRRIQFSFYTYDEKDLHVKVSMSEGSAGYGNEIFVSAKDEKEVDNNITKLDKIFGSISDQSLLFTKYKWVLFNISSLSVGYLTLKVFFTSIQLLDINAESLSVNKSLADLVVEGLMDKFPVSKYIMLLMISWILGVVVTVTFLPLIERAMNKTWPEIEFNFGPEPSRQAIKTRRTLYFIVVVVLLPILIGLST